jgi:hypothetical protein
MSCGNHTAEARNPSYGKVTLAILAFPDPRPGENMTAYRLANKLLFHEWYSAMFQNLAIWEPGIVLELPGQKGLSVLQPRLGLILSDLLEARSFAAVSSAHSVRCMTKLGKPAVAGAGGGADPESDVEAEDGDGHNSDDDDVQQIVVQDALSSALIDVDIEAIVAATPPNKVLLYAFRH